MKIVFATGNRGKLREAAEILGPDFELVTPADMGITEDVEETGSTLQENSILKARFVHERTGLNCFADDTGLEVDYLGGAPGVHSARYASDGHDFDANVRKLLAEMKDCPEGERTAHFRCVVTLIWNGEEYYFTGDMPGKIAKEKAGCGGFGYDPVFISDAYPQHTLAEMPVEYKNNVSHRGQSLRAMAEWLKKENSR